MSLPVEVSNNDDDVVIVVKRSSLSTDKPIGASPGRDYVLTRMVLQIIQYNTLHSVGNDRSKRGGTLRGLRIKKKERSTYVVVGILILRKPH